MYIYMILHTYYTYMETRASEPVECRTAIYNTTAFVQ